MPFQKKTTVSRRSVSKARKVARKSGNATKRSSRQSTRTAKKTARKTAQSARKVSRRPRKTTRKRRKRETRSAPTYKKTRNKVHITDRGAAKIKKNGKWVYVTGALTGGLAIIGAGGYYHLRLKQQHAKLENLVIEPVTYDPKIDDPPESVFLT